MAKPPPATPSTAPAGPSPAGGAGVTPLATEPTGGSGVTPLIAEPTGGPGVTPLLRRNKVKRYGWIPDLPDQRDHLFAAAPATLTALPAKADLRPGCPPVYDQGQLGSCSGNAVAGAVQFERMRQGLGDAAQLIPSRLFIYYSERAIEGTIGQDSGAQLRDGIKAVSTLGVCFESGADAWPYVITAFATQPPPPCYASALNDKVVQYSRISQAATQLKGCLAEGFPFIFGFTVYDSFEGSAVAQSGILAMPGLNETVVGGHAVMAVGYDDASQCFIVRNSWGPDWGLQGYFMMPYAYLTDPNLASDIWTIRLVDAPSSAGGH